MWWAESQRPLVQRFPSNHQWIPRCGPCRANHSAARTPDTTDLNQALPVADQRQGRRDPMARQSRAGIQIVGIESPPMRWTAMVWGTQRGLAEAPLGSGVTAASGLVHSMARTAANVHELKLAATCGEGAGPVMDAGAQPHPHGKGPCGQRLRG